MLKYQDFLKMRRKMKIIPIMFCFDKNYCIPASIAFNHFFAIQQNIALWGGVKLESKLESSNKEKLFYKLYVLHNDITKDYQDLLQDSIKPFSDFSTLHFINTSNTFAKQWSDISHKAHYAKEMLYKILLSSNFPKYDKIIVSDVDVVFLGDVSKSFLEFDTDDDIYISGVKMNNPNDLFPLTNWKKAIKSLMTKS